MNAEIICVESLVASLRDPEVLDGDIARNLYITSKSMGREGATGMIQQGDLSSDLSAKIIFFDRHADAFTVTRNGNPPRADEHVPDGDIGALVRSFVRDSSSTHPVVLTVTDTLVGKGVETIRKVIPAETVELYCNHGPDPSARGVPLIRAGFSDPVVSWTAIGLVVVGVIVVAFLYYKFVYSRRRPPDTLPDMRPIHVERRRGSRTMRSLGVDDDIAVSDVKSALKQLR